MKWGNLKAPGLWAPVATFAVYVAVVFLWTNFSLLIYVGRAGSLQELPVIAITVWANLVGQLAWGATCLGLLVRANPTVGLRGVLAAAREMRGRDWPLVLVLWVAGLGAGICIAVALTAAGLTVDPGRVQVLLHPAAWAAAVLVAPVVEELWGRGLLFGWLRRFGPWVAIAGTALVTAGLHLDAAQILGVLPMMLAMSWLRYRTGRLAPSIALHALNNLLLVAVLVVSGGAGG